MKEKIIPIYEPGLTWTDSQLMENFERDEPVHKLRLIGLVAQRCGDNPRLLDLLRQTAIDEKSQRSVFFGFIKGAWIPILAVVEYGTESTKKSLTDWVQYWSTDERELFMNYIKNHPEIVALFNSKKVLE